jgi:TonB family protein
MSHSAHRRSCATSMRLPSALRLAARLGSLGRSQGSDGQLSRTGLIGTSPMKLPNRVTLRKPMRRTASSLLGIFLCAALPPLWLCAQSSPNYSTIDDLARRTAERVAKAQPHRVLVLTVQGCLLDANVCGSLDQKIRAELQTAIPAVQLLARTDVLPLLPKHGLLPVDAYTSAVEPAAVDLGADLMVTESLTGIDGNYELSAAVMDLTKRRKLDEFKAKLKRPASNSSTEPLIFRQSADGPALVVPRVRNSGRKGELPSCEKCSAPPFTDEARARKIEGIVLLEVTITEQGVAEQISVVRGLNGGLTDSAVQTVRSWRFKPAVGPDGKPLVTRTSIEVNFVLRN